MAAGAKCKVRLFEPSSEYVKKSKCFQDIMQLGVGFSNTLHLFELEYGASFSNGLTEISAPNAVFNGTATSVPLGIVSSNAADDKDSTAVQKVKVISLDSNGEPDITEYTMEGTTAVPIDTYPERLMHMYSTQWGADTDATGNIILARRGYHQLATPADITGDTETGLTANTLYYFKVNINGAGVLEYYITVTTASCTFATLLTLLAAAKAVVGGATISGVTWSLESGDLRCTSNSTLDTASIAITAGTTGTDLLASLTGFSSVDTAVGSGYQEIGLTGITGASETGLTPQAEYYFTIDIDGAGAVEYYITTSTVAVTFDQLISLLNSAILESDDVTVISGVTFSLTGGDIRCTSSSTATTASIDITAGSTGTDLLASLTGFTAVDAEVESGYQEIGLTGKTESTETGLTPSTLYYFTLTLNGGAATEYYITTTTVAVTFTQLLVLLAAAKKVSDDAAISGITFSLSGGDLVATSNERGATSAVLIAAGTTGTDLLATLTDFSAMDAAAYIAYQEVGLSGKETENLTGLLATSQYYFKINVDGAGVTEFDITTSTDLSFTAIIALMNTATTSAATWSLTGGDLRCTSDAVDGTGSIALSAGTTGDDLFAQLTGWSTFDTAQYIGYQEFGLSGKTGSTATGLTTTSTYYYKINIDGAGEAEESIIVTAGSTLFSDIITLLDAGISGAAFTIVGGDLRCTSADTTASAAIALSITALSGTSLFESMTGFSALETAKGSAYQEFGLSGKTGTDATGLTAVQTYYYKANVDGTGVAEKNFNVTAGSTTFTDIMTALNASIAGAVWSVTGGDLRLTSSTSIATSAIALSYASLTGASFIEGLTGFSALETAAGIGYQEFGLTGKTTTTETGLTASNTYYFKVNVNGAGVVEYDITVDTTTDTTYDGIIALMNAALTTGAVGAEFGYPDLKLRCTSDSAAAASAIALSAGSTGLDLFATLTGWTAFESAVAYELYLTIAAGANESDGAALWVPEDWNMSIRELILSPTSYAAVARAVEVKAARTYMDGIGADPDFSYEIIRVAAESTSTAENPCRIRNADANAKLTFSETYLGGAMDGFFHAVVAIFDPTNTGRGIDTRS